jgi:superfamily I DNA/RNA helicase
MQLDPDQQACVDAPLGPVAIVAGPGAGKTRTVVARIAGLVGRGEVAADRILALTHTTKAAGELKDRLATAGVEGVHVSTVHALALKQVRRFAPLLGQREPALVGSTYGLVKEAARTEVGSVDGAVVAELCSEIDWAASRLLTPQEYPSAAARDGRTLSLTAEQVADVMAGYQQLKSRDGVVDFADLLTLAREQLRHDQVRQRVRAAFGAIFVDEYQDIDPLQQSVIDAWLDGRDAICVVGDADQCHPPGTIVTTQAGPVPIEELDPSVHRLRQIDPATGRYRLTRALEHTTAPGPAGFALAGRRYQGPLVTVATTSPAVPARSHAVTPEHLCLARWCPRKLAGGGAIAVYLARQDGSWGLGLAPLDAETGPCIPPPLAPDPASDASWILRVYSDRGQASVALTVIALSYGIPGVVPPDPSPDNSGGYDELVRHSRNAPLIERRARQLLSDLRLSVDLPFRCVQGGSDVAQAAPLVLAAANLVEGWMEVPVDPSPDAPSTADTSTSDPSAADLRPLWSPFRLTHHEYDGEVYSLAVPEHHNYVANGISTHNCIFGFKGADPKFLEDFARRYPTATQVQLVRNYRSSSEVVDWVNKVALHKRTGLVSVSGKSAIHPQATFHDDESAEEAALVRQLRSWQRQGIPWSQMAVLYRYNAIAVRLEAALSAGSVPYTVAGSQRFFERPEIRAVLVPFGQAARQHPDHDGAAVLAAAAAGTGWDPARVPEGAGAARQRHDAVLALLDLVAERYAGMPARTLLGALQERARESHDPGISAVTLATVHASKGLEWDAVWIASAVDGVLPSSYAATPAQLAEERHLFYVAVSRARTHLVVSAAERRHNGMRNRPSPFISLVAPNLAARHQPRRRQGGDSSGRYRRRTSSSSTRLPDRAGSSDSVEMPVVGLPTPASEYRSCAACGNRLVGAPAIRSRRCSGFCLTGEDRAVFDRLLGWRDSEASRRQLAPAELATDKALFAIAVRRDATNVAGLYLSPGDVPTQLLA